MSLSIFHLWIRMNLQKRLTSSAQTSILSPPLLWRQTFSRVQRKGKWCDTLLLARARILAEFWRARTCPLKIRALAKSRVSHHFPFRWSLNSCWWPVILSATSATRLEFHFFSTSSNSYKAQFFHSTWYRSVLGISINYVVKILTPPPFYYIYIYKSLCSISN